MPQKKSAIKELRKRTRKTARNKQIKRRLHDIKKEVESVEKGKEKDLYKKAQKLIDKSAKTGNPFNKKKAARIKSRIAKKLNKKA